MLGEVGGLRLGQQDHVALGEQLLAGAHPADRRGELVVGDAEPLAVPVLQEDPGPQAGVDAVEVLGVDRQAVLVLLRATAT